MTLNKYLTGTSLYINYFILLFILILGIAPGKLRSQGTWVPLTNLAPDLNEGVMLLLTDGTVIVKTMSGGGDSFGNVWNKLTPDSTGSYVNGTWSYISPMNDTRLYFSSQVLQDGRVYVAGGEYGTGGATSEIYDPVADTWTELPVSGDTLLDANSEMLPDGRILQAVVRSTFMGLRGNIIYDCHSNIYIPADTSLGSHDESAWLKLPDNSILFVDLGSTSSERYIPALGKWVGDGTVPIALYDSYIDEMGGALLLPDGRGFFLGSTGHTAYYTPSGDSSPGTWTAGPDIPLGFGTADAATSMMPNGKILIAGSQFPDASVAFHDTTSFFEFDYLSNSFTMISAPNGYDTLVAPCYTTNMLNLPDGSILFGLQSSSQYSVYMPSGSQIVSGKPTINSVKQNACDSFTVTGTLFNGISEGSSYGDDWQMATNYPIVRIMDGAKVYYAKTFNWNSTGVQRGSLPDSVRFVLPAGLTEGATYYISVAANGIRSDSVPFYNASCITGIAPEKTTTKNIHVYPDPADESTILTFNSKSDGAYIMKLTDLFGRIVKEENIAATAGENSHLIKLEDVSKGIYIVSLQNSNSVSKIKIVVK